MKILCFSLIIVIALSKCFSFVKTPWVAKGDGPMVLASVECVKPPFIIGFKSGEDELVLLKITQHGGDNY